MASDASSGTADSVLNDPELVRKRNNLFIFLSGIFLTNAILAELIGTKIFSLERSLGFPPARLEVISGYELSFDLTAGVVIWPVVFITTDIINEYFGKKGVRKISYLAALFIIYAFVIIYFVTDLTPAEFWTNINATDPAGNPFNIDYAFGVIFRQGMGIIAGSLIAFLIGQLLDVFVFQKLRRITGNKMIWLRATGSTLVSQLVDSFVVLFVAFYIFGAWPLSQVAAVGLNNYFYKFAIAIALTPLLYVAHYLIDRYLGVKNAERVMEEASRESKGFF
ncbi:queuosine precursor transporter [Roseivirga sp. BDSF3-8]|uniref:queuosine precursor transporter n=1 Tax=Roseivirga sp. BDSF3-8 TaxID=3241598 RepID=UPI003531A681